MLKMTERHRNHFAHLETEQNSLFHPSVGLPRSVFVSFRRANSARPQFGFEIIEYFAVRRVEF
jgi:hypothetical protein